MIWRSALSASCDSTVALWFAGVGSMWPTGRAADAVLLTQLPVRGRVQGAPVAEAETMTSMV